MTPFNGLGRVRPLDTRRHPSPPRSSWVVAVDAGAGRPHRLADAIDAWIEEWGWVSGRRESTGSAPRCCYSGSCASPPSRRSTRTAQAGLLTVEEWDAWRSADETDLHIAHACLVAQYEQRASRVGGVGAGAVGPVGLGRPGGHTGRGRARRGTKKGPASVTVPADEWETAQANAAYWVRGRRRRAHVGLGSPGSGDAMTLGLAAPSSVAGPLRIAVERHGQE